MTIQSLQSKWLLILLIMGITNIHIMAQDQPHKEKCAFDHQLKEAQKSPYYQAIRDQAEHFIKNYKPKKSGSTIKIPCVVHIVHTGQAAGTIDNDNAGNNDGANPSDAQINSAISDMTAAFQHTGAYSSKNTYTASLDVEFVLAKVDPTGATTTGIKRYDVSGESWGTDYANNGMDAGQTPGVAQATITESRFWPPMDYMNIWVVHEVENATSTLGFASFPQSNAGATDGLTMLATAFGYDPENDDGYLLDAATNLNGTANHEVGHYLNLYHTFQGDNNGASCPGDVTVGTDSDGCADIDPHKRSSGCPSDATNNTCVSPTGANDYIHNFMDYADDACFHGFSANQKTRMDAALADQRKALGNSVADDATAGDYPTAVVATPSVTNADQTMGIYEVTLNGTTWTSWSSHHDGGYANRVASSSYVELTANTMYTLTVKVGVGNTTNDELINVYIDYNNDGDFDDAGETIHTTSGGSGKKNGDSYSISFTTPTSPTVTNKRIRMRIISDFDNGVNPITSKTASSQGGQIEDYSISFGSPLPVELAYFNGKIIDFNDAVLSWETFSEKNNKGFEIQRSTDGKNFETIGFVNGNGTTQNASAYRYMDENLASGKWYYRLKQMDFDGQFEYSSIIILEVEKGFDVLKVYPNPTNDVFTIELGNIQVDEFNLELYSTTGQLLKSIQFQNNQVSYSLKDWDIPTGIYFLKVRAGQYTQTIKLSKL